MSSEEPSIPLFCSDLQVSLMKQKLVPSMASNQGRSLGEQQPPIDFVAAAMLMLSVNIQETCIRTKRDAIVGLGFESQDEKDARDRQRELDMRSHELAMGAEPSPVPKKKPLPKEGKDAVAKAAAEPKAKSKVEEVLDPLCGDHGFQMLLNQCGEDYENTGQCYIEVVRDDSGAVTALWFMPASGVRVVNEKEKPFFHYIVHQNEGGDTVYAVFGDLEDGDQDSPGLRERLKIDPSKQITELICIRQATSFDPNYGLPSWLSAVPWLELAQKVMQCDFDYFNNRAVPDLLVLLTGAKVPDADLTSLKTQISQTVGAGKRHRSVIANLPHPDTKVTFERLNADNRERFTDLWTAIQLQVVSTHRVPPLLAGVVLPGKMAANNELPNALVAFQTLYVQQHQKNFETRLANTLGAEESLGLSADDFVLRKITDYYDIGQLDTMSRMRETATEAAAQGRQLDQGLKE